MTIEVNIGNQIFWFGEQDMNDCAKKNLSILENQVWFG